MKASILIRSMDRPTLARALDSAAAQTHGDVELVVVAACGASHRSLPQTWNGRPLNLVASRERLDRARAANAALDAAAGEWLNFLDDDDELMPHHVATLLADAAGSDARVRYSTAQVRDLDGRVVGLSGRAGVHMQLYNQNRCQPVATLFHRSLVEEGARFDPAFEVLEDQDFFLNCATRTRFAFVDAVTCVWHGFAGDSGCGYGANADDAKRIRHLELLRSKWADVFERWKREPEALLYLGQHHLRTGDLSVALDCLERALAERPDDPNALNLCGMAHHHAGNRARAVELLEAASRILPAHPAIQGNLALARKGH
jgi:tetratricopeptide (TPR) repeat protein